MGNRTKNAIFIKYTRKHDALTQKTIAAAPSSRRPFGGAKMHAETVITAPIPRRSGKGDSKGTRPFGARRAGAGAGQGPAAVRAGPPAAKSKLTAGAPP